MTNDDPQSAKRSGLARCSFLVLGRAIRFQQVSFSLAHELEEAHERVQVVSWFDLEFRSGSAHTDHAVGEHCFCAMCQYE
jgi:hypothetical protein